MLRFVSLLACCVLGALATVAEWPQLPSLINTGDLDSYLDVLGLALVATKLSYTATWGGYRNPADVNASVSNGWVRIHHLEKDPSGGGFHGIVFFHNESGRAILAFRGTDLSTDPSALADTCADKLLWSNTSWESLPRECHRFSVEVLDYLSAAQSFTDAALDTLHISPSQALFTGHSLGAGLAVLVAADRKREERFRPKVLAFSAPPFDAVLRDRVARQPLELNALDLVVVYNKFDPLLAQSRQTNGGVGATSCIFEPVPEPTACHHCYDTTLNMSSSECQMCFVHTHVYKYYLEYLMGTVEKPPRYRPACPHTDDVVLM